MEKAKSRWKGPASNKKEAVPQVGALRGQGCTNRARSESEISVPSSTLRMRVSYACLHCRMREPRTVRARVVFRRWAPINARPYASPRSQERQSLQWIWSGRKMAKILKKNERRKRRKKTLHRLGSIQETRKLQRDISDA